MIVTDAWFPQINGVTHTLAYTAAWLGRSGHEVRIVAPNDGMPCPTYPEIRLALLPYRMMAKRIASFQPQALHIATEGPLGFAARRYCMRHGLVFTTSYHTQFPQYLRSRFPIPIRLSYLALRSFHNGAHRCMVSTPTVQRELAAHGFKHLVRWQRGVDTQLFRLRSKGYLTLPRPIAACVGRVAIDKNVAAFLRMPWPGTKIVIGDGPELAKLQSLYLAAQFLGLRRGEDLAAHMAAADVVVFQSRTGTFGLVNLEALACGVPVAAYPVTGPIDVIENGVTGVLDEELARAALRALNIDPQACRRRALQSGWDVCTREFESKLIACRPLAASASARARAVVRRLAT